MWLLNAETRKLEFFVDDRQLLIQYAILSHTWDDQEVTFDDIHQDHARLMKGYLKLDFACSQALRDGLSYVWVDTCCIDKKSSAELSEAINSMYRWYHDSMICYAYLSDVDLQANLEITEVFEHWSTDVAGSRWFKRGWTLQELIAPKEVRFFDSSWYRLGSKTELVDELEAITKVSASVLRDRTQLQRASVAQRMSWAADRSTSRIEDQAYALLGLFDVNMPLLYGEGSRAYTRLQEEIIRAQNWEDRDHSILIWDSDDGDPLAPSPREFVDGHRIISWTPPLDETFEFSKKGLCITVLARPEFPETKHIQLIEGISNSSSKGDADVLIAVLNCRYDDQEQLHQLAIQLQRRPRIASLGHFIQNEDRFDTVYDKLPGLTMIDQSDLFDFTPMDITIARKPYCWPSRSIRNISITGGLTLIEECPMNTISWHRGHAILQLDMDEAVEARGSIQIRKRMDSEEWPDVVLAIRLVHEFKKPPKLFVGVENGTQHTFREGEQHMLEIGSKQVLRVTASYLLMDKDLLWHLYLTRPVLAKDMSDLQTLDGTEHTNLRRLNTTNNRAAAGNNRLSSWSHNTRLPEVFEGYGAIPEVIHAQLESATAPLLQEQLLQRHMLVALADAVERIQSQLASQGHCQEPRGNVPQFPDASRSRIEHARKPLKTLRNLLSGFLGRKASRIARPPATWELDGVGLIATGVGDVVCELPAEPVVLTSSSIHPAGSVTSETQGTLGTCENIDEVDFEASSSIVSTHETWEHTNFSFVESTSGEEEIQSPSGCDMSDRLHSMTPTLPPPSPPLPFTSSIQPEHDFSGMANTH